MSLRPEHHVLHYESGVDGIAFEVIDPCSACGGCQARRLDLWDNLLCSRPDAIVFVVDASDVERFPEAQESLRWIFRHRATAGLPVVILGNKVDLRGAVGSWDLKCGLGLTGLSSEQRHALLGRTGETGLPFDLRQRIANFHPHEACAPPHRGPLAVRMCSIEKDWSAHTAMHWVVQEAARTYRKKPPRMPQCRAQLVGRFGGSSLLKILRCSDVIRRKAAPRRTLLP